MNKLWHTALILAVITVFYNLLEGFVSLYFGISDETISLFGFGIDSFIEVLSGIGIWHLIIRIKNNGEQNRDRFERTALRITAVAFFILCGGLMITIFYNIYTHHHPQTTFWGIIIAGISILTMIILMLAKISIGKKLNSKAIIADAHCTKTCVYLSVILLLASILYEFFKIGYFDSIGALGIAYYAFKEGRESWDKANGKACCDCNNHEEKCS